MERRSPAAAPLPAREFGYHPGLDGLRAVAVLAVLAYHGGLPHAVGGALGVDIFFVLSGFLITSLLVQEVARTDRLSFSGFYLRRLRRLYPALLLLLVGVALYALATSTGDRSPTIRRDSFAALFYVANWAQIWWHQSYFAASGTPSPVRHLWSLAVEEQWYLFWPVVLLALLRLTGRRLSVALAVVATLALASAAWMAHLAPRFTDPSRAYYGTDSHAQTLLVGAGLAILLWWRPVSSAALRRALAVAGPVALVGCVGVMARFEATSTRLYHGGFLLFALGVAVTVASIVTVPTAPLARVLALRPARWIGHVSYSLYLWHWLIDVWLNPTVVHWSRWPLFALRTALAFGAATLSYYVVEQPVRTAGWRKLRRPAFTTLGAFGAATVLVAALCWSIGSSSSTSSAAALTGDRPTIPKGGLRVVVVGDSVGWSIARADPKPPLLHLANAALLGCGVLPKTLIVGDTPVQQTVASECGAAHATWDQALSYPTSLVLVSWGAWEVYDHVVDGHIYRVPTSSYRKLLLSRARSELAYLRAHTRAPIVILDVPCVHQPDYQLGNAPNPRDDPAKVAWINGVFEEAVRGGPSDTSILHWSAWLCPDGRPRNVIDGTVLRPDGLHFTHLTAHYAWEWLLPRLRPIAAAR